LTDISISKEIIAPIFREINAEGSSSMLVLSNYKTRQEGGKERKKERKKEIAQIVPEICTILCFHGFLLTGQAQRHSSDEHVACPPRIFIILTAILW
jgi:hypothetical protein